MRHKNNIKPSTGVHVLEKIKEIKWKTCKERIVEETDSTEVVPVKLFQGIYRGYQATGQHEIQISLETKTTLPHLEAAYRKSLQLNQRP